MMLAVLVYIWIVFIFIKHKVEEEEKRQADADNSPSSREKAGINQNSKTRNQEKTENTADCLLLEQFTVPVEEWKGSNLSSLRIRCYLEDKVEIEFETDEGVISLEFSVEQIEQIYMSVGGAEESGDDDESFIPTVIKARDGELKICHALVGQGFTEEMLLEYQRLGPIFKQALENLNKYETFEGCHPDILFESLEKGNYYVELFLEKSGKQQRIYLDDFGMIKLIMILLAVDKFYINGDIEWNFAIATPEYLREDIQINGLKEYGIQNNTVVIFFNVNLDLVKQEVLVGFLEKGEIYNFRCSLKSLELLYDLVENGKRVGYGFNQMVENNDLVAKTNNLFQLQIGTEYASHTVGLYAVLTWSINGVENMIFLDKQGLKFFVTELGNILDRVHSYQ